jgi:MFS family permease
LCTLLLFTCINWTLEARKWQLLIRTVEKVSLFTGFKAVLSGLSFGLFVPNGVGDYIGRMIYMRHGNRLRSIAVNFVGSLAQLIMTFSAGLIGLRYLLLHVPDIKLPENKFLSPFWIQGLQYGVALGLLVLLLLFFKISLFTKWFEKIPIVNRHKIFIQSLEEYNLSILTRILIIAFLRFSVFIIQYLLVFHLFKVNLLPVQVISITCAYFLFLAVIPTIPIAEFGIRGQFGIYLFGIFSSNTIGIISGLALIWIINVIIPALIGSLLVLSVRVFRK